MEFEVLRWIVGILFASGVAYGAIRADLRAMHIQIAQAVIAATRAHERLDNHLEKGH